MTPYQQGFITKCAERGLTVKQAQSLLDTIASNPYYSAGIGALGGGALAGLGTAAFGKRDPDTGKKKYIRNMLLGVLGGGAAGLGANMYRNIRSMNKAIKAQDYYESLRNGFNDLQAQHPEGAPGETPLDRANYYNAVYRAASAADQARRAAGFESNQAQQMVRDLVSRSNLAGIQARQYEWDRVRAMHGNMAATGELYPGFSTETESASQRPQEIKVNVRRRPQ